MHNSELRSRRRKLGLSQAQLGQALGVDANTIARWERGDLTIRHPRVLRLALQALDDDHAAASNEERRAMPWPDEVAD